MQSKATADVTQINHWQEHAANVLIQETIYSEQLHTSQHSSEENWMKSILKDGYVRPTICFLFRVP